VHPFAAHRHSQTVGMARVRLPESGTSCFNANADSDCVTRLARTGIRIVTDEFHEDVAKRTRAAVHSWSHGGFPAPNDDEFRSPPEFTD
jgi:hypothetical protein